MIKNILLSLISFYQRHVSVMISARCRYYPTCSTYAKQAIVWHGATKGLWLAVCRIGSCHPWGGSGVDFVPLPLANYRYKFSQMTIRLVYKDTSSYTARLNYLIKNTK